MSVSQPDILTVFGESSGTTLTEHGTLSGTDWTLGSNPSGTPVEDTHYFWNPNADETLSYFLKQTSSFRIFFTTAATTPGTTLETINGAIKFRLLNNAGGSQRLFGDSVGSQFGRAVAAAVSGDFDVQLFFFGLSATSPAATIRIGAGQTIDKELSFGVDYKISWSLDVSTLTAVVLTATIDAETPVATSPVNWTGSTQMADEWPTIFADGPSDAGSFADYRAHYFAYQRGGTAWSASDLSDINSDPAANITGWPGGGGGGGTDGAGMYRHLQNMGAY